MEAPKINSVSVVIPNYNGKELLRQYLPYLFRAIAACPQITESEVIVVDDASTDGSSAYLSAEWGQIRLIENEQNSGFGKSVNRGIAAARFEAVCLLNTDMQVAEDYFTVLLPLLEQNTQENTNAENSQGAGAVEAEVSMNVGVAKTEVFGVYCAIRDPKSRTITEGRKQMRIHHHKLSYIDLCGEQEEGESMYICGGNALIWRDKLLALGGYDQLFSPFYFEDMDLSLRAKARGWVSLYTTRTSCLHQHAATIGSLFSPESVQEVFIRNRVFINYRYLHGRTWFISMLHAVQHAAKELICSRTYRPYCKALKQILHRHGSE